MSPTSTDDFDKAQPRVTIMRATLCRAISEESSHATMPEPISNEFVCSGDRSRGVSDIYRGEKHKRASTQSTANENREEQLESVSLLPIISFAVLSLRRRTKTSVIDRMKFLDLKSR